MAQSKPPRNPLAFASVLYPGRRLASQPIHLGSEVVEGGISAREGGRGLPPKLRPAVRGRWTVSTIGNALWP